MKWTFALRSLLILFLVFPFIFLFTRLQYDPSIDYKEILWAFKNSFRQAFFSALFSLILGFLTALAVVSLNIYSTKWRAACQMILLLPNLLPPLFVLLATLTIIDPFPMGLTGIVLIHTLINYGLVAVIITNLMNNKLGGFCELAYIEGASTWLFFKKVFVKILARDLLFIFIFVFTVCFSSFSIPMVVGGSHGTTMEVLIYDKMRNPSHWGSATMLSLIQSILMFLFSFFAQHSHLKKAEKQYNLKLISNKLFFIIPITATFMLVLGYGQSVYEGLSHLANLYEIQDAIIECVAGTMCLSVLAGSLFFVIINLVLFSCYSRLFLRFMSGYFAPSTALACFCFLVVGPNSSYWPFLKVSLAFILLNLNTMFRMSLRELVTSLQAQTEMGWLLGAKPLQIFKKIVFPQSLKTTQMLSAIIAAWVSGDYAVSRILSHHDFTIALMSETLMSSYRLELATVLSIVALFCGVACYFLVYWGTGVISRKFIS